MTTKEAISRLEGYMDDCTGFYVLEEPEIHEAIAALREQEARENPRSLTATDLLTRDDRPVYVVPTSKSNGGWDAYWGIVNAGSKAILDVYESALPFDDVGIIGKVYDYPPTEDTEMNEKTITITLDRADWVSLGKDLTANLGKTADIMPTVRLLESLAKSGIEMSELDPKGGTQC